MKRVFVTQMTLRMDGDRLVPQHDLSAAKKHGELIPLVSPSARPFGLNEKVPTSIIAELEEKLKDFDDDDHLLLLGNPAIIGMATSIAAIRNHGRVHLLQWDRVLKRYFRIPIQLNISPR